MANVSVSISFEHLHFCFYNISIFKITIISVSVNVGSIISVSVIISVTEISLLETGRFNKGVYWQVNLDDLIAVHERPAAILQHPAVSCGAPVSCGFQTDCSNWPSVKRYLQQYF